MSEDAIRATPAEDRIEALDFVRGCALFGILLMNITGMGQPHAAYVDPTVWGGSTGADLWAWIVIQVGFDGTQRGLFSVLFGAGIVLFTARLDADGRETADLYARRNLILVGLGMINAWVLLWWGDILYAYGIAALLLFPFRKLAARTLLGLGIAILLFNAAWNASDTAGVLAKSSAFEAASAAKARGVTLSDAQNEAIEAWQATVAESKPDPETTADEVAKMRGGYASAYEPVAELNLVVQSWWLYRFFSDIAGMMLIGMALFKAGVLTLERRTSLYVAMLVGGYAVGLATNIAEARWIVDRNFGVLAMSQANISYDLGRLAMTVGHLGLLLLFCRSGWLAPLRRAMAAVGRMALTNYLTHSLVALVLFVLLGQFGQFARHELYYIVFAVWGVQLIVSPLWLKHYRFGPVEWVWRSLTYGKWARLRGPAGTPLAA